MLLDNNTLDLFWQSQLIDFVHILATFVFTFVVTAVVYKTLEFLAEESCGKCAPCREGTEVMIEILVNFFTGKEDVVL